jgi:hypothetical protein
MSNRADRSSSDGAVVGPVLLSLFVCLNFGLEDLTRAFYTQGRVVGRAIIKKGSRRWMAPDIAPIACATGAFSNRYCPIGQYRLTEKMSNALNDRNKKRPNARLASMAERRPIYSAQTAGQQIGYIEDDEAFDLFDRPCAIYDSNTGLLRDPKNNAVAGYVSLADVFIGPSRTAHELFPETGPVSPPTSSEGLKAEGTDAPVCGVEDHNAEDVDAFRLIAPAPPSHNATKNELSVAPTPVDSEKASVEGHTSDATDTTTLASSFQEDKVIDAVLAAPTSPLLGDSSTEQLAQPQDASDAGKGFASGESESDRSTRAIGGTAPALQPDADAGVTMLATCDESTFESARPDEPSGGDGMPPAVEVFMRHLTEYLHSSDRQTATLSLDDAAEVKLSPSAQTQKDIDPLPFPAGPDPEGESSGSAQHSGLAAVDREQPGDCAAVEMPRDNHQEGNSGAAGGVEANDASRDIFSTDKDRILRAVLREVQKDF